MSFFRRPQPPIRVEDVDKPRSVPFLRPLEWMAIAFKTFRERPLPSSYFTEARPVFDIFGNSRLPEVQFEEVQGTLGLTEVVSTRVDADKFRLYLSFAYRHDDAVTSPVVLQAIRIIDDGGAFPQIPLADPPLTAGSTPPNLFFTLRNVTVPPSARIGATIDALAAGARITLRSLFIDYSIGESVGSIT